MGMNTASVQRLYVAYFNRPADPVSLSVYEAMLPTDSVATQAELLVLAETYFSPSPEFQTNFDGKSNSQIVDQLYQNIFGRTADVPGLLDWSTQLTSGEITVAELALQLSYSAQGTDATVVDARIEAAVSFTEGLDTTAKITGYSGDAAAAEGRAYLAQISGELPTDDATIGAEKDAAITNVDASIDAAVDAGSSNANPGETFALTTGSNVFTGTSGNDTFDAGLSTGALQTLNSGDRLDGSGGTDSLFTVINQSATPAQLKDIEKIFVTSITNAATMDLTNATGVESVVNQASQTALTLSGMSTAVAVTVQDTAIAGQVVAYSGVTGLTDEATVTLQNVTGAATLTVAGVETLNLATAGTNAQTLANLIAANATTLNLSGSSALTFTSAAGAAAVSTVNASEMTGVLTLNLDTALSVSVTGGSAGDALTMDRVFSDSVVGGDGNDTVTFTGAGTLDVGDTISGGDGTDTLVGNITDLGNMTALTAGLRTGFERITVSDALAGTLTTANVQAGIDRVTLGLGGTGTLNLDAGDRTVVLAAALTAGGLTANDTGVALTDSLTISNGGNATNTFGGRLIATGGYETLTLNTSGLGAATAQTVTTVTMTGEAGGTTALKVTGSNAFTTTGAVTAQSIDASGLTGAAALTLGAAAVGVSSITGSDNSDTLVGDASSSISGGSGNDTITGGGGNDTLEGGAGNDVITTGGGAGDNVKGGDGDDTVAATLTSGNVMVGGDGTDVLSLGVAATAATATGVSEFETLRSTAATTHDMALFLDNNTFTQVQGAVAGVSAFTNVAANVTTATSLIAGSTVTVARLVDTATSELNVVLLGNATTLAVTANDEETINLLTTAAVGATTVTTLTSSDLQTLNISGSNAVVITNLAANTTTTGTVLTVDGSANTGGVTVDASASTIVATMTGSELASNVLTGTGGSDTITGGSLADTIVGGVGADVLTGGLGVDTFTFANTATGVPTATGNFDTIVDYTTGDLINGPGAITLVAEGTIGVGQAEISAAGLASFNIADDTLGERIVATEAAMTAATLTADEAAVFNFGGDAYVFISDGNAGLDATDVLIKLTGVTATTGMTLDTGDINSVT